jgi:hypothetical protein
MSDETRKVKLLLDTIAIARLRAWLLCNGAGSARRRSAVQPKRVEKSAAAARPLAWHDTNEPRWVSATSTWV